MTTDTFRHNNVAKVTSVSAACPGPIAELTLPSNAVFDYIVTQEDLGKGQRIANYSIEYQAHDGGNKWEILVSPSNKSDVDNLGDRPDGHDPRDS